MPIGPNGEKRPSNPIEAAIIVARIALGDVEEEYVEEKNPTTLKRGRGGKKGGKARAEALTLERRSKIASNAAKARWKKNQAALTTNSAFYHHLIRCHKPFTTAKTPANISPQVTI